DTWAATTYAELIERAGPAGERHATTLSLSLDMKTSARQIRTAGGGIRGAAAVLPATSARAVRRRPQHPGVRLRCSALRDSAPGCVALRAGLSVVMPLAQKSQVLKRVIVAVVDVITVCARCGAPLPLSYPLTPPMGT